MVAPRNHSLAEKGEKHTECNHPWIDIGKFKQDRFILFSPEQRTRQIIDKVIQGEGFTPKSIFVTSNVQASVALVAKGYGITFVPETHLKHIGLNSEVVAFSIGNPKIAVNFVAAFRKGGYIPAYAQDYIKIVKKYT
jgi:DNA-binding transcriptional LysR family regulator